VPREKFQQIYRLRDTQFDMEEVLCGWKCLYYAYNICPTTHHPTPPKSDWADLVVPNQLNTAADGLDTICIDGSYKMVALRLQTIWDCLYFFHKEWSQ
jgi:hypothetical protein